MLIDNGRANQQHVCSVTETLVGVPFKHYDNGNGCPLGAKMVLRWLKLVRLLRLVSTC